MKIVRLTGFAASAITAAACLLHPAFVSAQTGKLNHCATCHTSLPQANLSAPPKAVVGDVHDKAGVRCVDCHGGDVSATNEAAAHDPLHGYRGKPSGAAICSTCHTLLDEKFKTSVHAPIFEKACVECHGNHGVKKPSDAMLGTGEDAVCATCHGEQDDPGFAAAGHMRASIDKLTQSIHSSTELIDAAKNAGMEVGDQELALTEANTKLTLAKTEMHAFNPTALDAVANDGMKVIERANQGGNHALAELAYRRRGLFVSLGAILLFVIALGVKIRSLDRPSSR